MRGLALIVVVGLAGCSDALDQDTAVGQVIAVVNTRSNGVTLVDATRFTATSFGLALGGVPTTLAARGDALIVPLGSADAVQAATTLAPGGVFALARGSGATGAVIEDDSIAWVANPGLNTVTRLNYRSGDTTSVAVGAFPQALAIADRVLYVVNGNVTSGVPAGPSWVTALPVPYRPGGPNPAPDSIELTGTNAKHVVAGDDGLLYIVMAGTAGRGDGRVAIVDPATRREVAVVNGFGESPGPAQYHPTGRLLVASPTDGILELNAATRTVVRGPGAGIKPVGDVVSALAIDPRGRVYAAAGRGCGAPGVVHVLTPPPEYRVLETVSVGVCPAAAALAQAAFPR